MGRGSVLLDILDSESEKRLEVGEKMGEIAILKHTQKAL